MDSDYRSMGLSDRQWRILSRAYLRKYGEESEFCHRLFSGHEKSFVMALWRLCTSEDDELCKFLFELYGDAKSLVVDMCTAEFVASPSFARLVQQQEDLPRNGAEFAEFARKCPGIVEPAFELKRRMRQKVGGERFWRGMAAAPKFVHEAPADSNAERHKSRKIKATLVDDAISQRTISTSGALVKALHRDRKKLMVGVIEDLRTIAENSAPVALPQNFLEDVSLAQNMRRPPGNSNDDKVAREIVHLVEKTTLV